MQDSNFSELVADLQRRIGRELTAADMRLLGTINGYPIARIQALKLKMYQEPGHSLPHIHVDLGRQHHIASYSIDPAKLLEGRLNARSDFIVLDWLATNKERLIGFWHSLQDGQPDFSIIAEL
jgi:Domain of unknown function (DUF4160)